MLLFTRPKVGFAAPTQRWFKEGNYFKPYFKDVLERQQKVWGAILNFPALQNIVSNNHTGPKDYSTQLWTLQNLIALDN